VEPALPQEPAPPPPAPPSLREKTFIVNTTAPAEGYLNATAGERVTILHDEDPDWYYGSTPTGAAGWFPRVNVG
jgi:hypothetical protein